MYCINRRLYCIQSIRSCIVSIQVVVYCINRQLYCISRPLYCIIVYCIVRSFIVIVIIITHLCYVSSKIGRDNDYAYQIVLVCDIQDGYWGFGQFHPDGCSPCDCDLGGAINGHCGQADGQCFCRPNVIGISCTEPAAGFYFPNLDHLLYEAEVANTRGVRSLFISFSSKHLFRATMFL